MSAPLVSIGLPVFNGARTLERVLDELRRQDHDNLEIIVSDNGSTDDSRAIAERIATADKRVRVHGEAVNRGAVWNFNRVLELARGDFFMWAAHDDRRDPSYVSRCLEPLLAAADIAVCHSQVERIDGAGNTIAIDRTPLHALDERPRDRFRRTLEKVHWTFAIYGLHRRAHLLRTQLFRNYYGSDLGLIAELTLYGKIAQIDAPLFSYADRPYESANAYLKRVTETLDPNNRYNPWVPVRAVIAREYLTSIRRAPLAPSEKLLLAGDVARHLAFGPWTREDLLRQLVFALGPARVERWRAWKRRLTG